MIRVWLPSGLWGHAALADVVAVGEATIVKQVGRKVLLQASGGGIEGVRRRATEIVRMGVSDPRDIDPSTMRCAQIALAAINRLGWRPLKDENAIIYSNEHDTALAVRIDGYVVPRTRCAWLQDIALHEGAPPRTGNGARALRAFESWAAEVGAEVVRLIAPRSATGFWLRQHYTLVGTDAGGSTRMVRVLAEQAPTRAEESRAG